MARGRCSRVHLAARIREARRVRPGVKSELRPLFNHFLRLASSSAKAGYCQRAGREIAYAKRLTRYL